MPASLPSADLQLDITAPSALAAHLKSLGATGSGESWDIAPTHLDVIGDFNVRIRNTEAWEEQVASLMESIRANGFLRHKPIAVVADATAEGTHLWIVDGHTRYEAVSRLINEGVEIERVPIILSPKTTTFEDMLVNLVTSNTGKPLTPYEMSLVVKRLQNYGWGDTRIATRLGMTTPYVSHLSVLAGAPAKIRNQVVAGKLSATEAVAIVRKHGGKASEVVEKAAEKARIEGKARITRKTVDAVTSDTPKTDMPPAWVSDTAKADKPAPGPSEAIDYALDVAADGLAWLRLWRAGDTDTLAELAAFVDPDGGL
jgi:ParB family chromosome partitioning protein